MHYFFQTKSDLEYKIFDKNIIFRYLLPKNEKIRSSGEQTFSIL